MTTSTTSPSVKDRLQEMLLATERFDDSTGELMARWADAFYTTMAARTGVAAQDLYKRFPLRVRSQDARSRPVMARSPAVVKPSRADRKADKAMLGRPRSSQTSSERVTDTPEFKRWFGGSKVVVAADGRPMVVYHGTDSEFTEFRRAHIAEPEHEGGFFFTPKYDIAADFGDRVLPVYLSIRKPKVMTAAQWGEMGDSVEQLRAKGYDGIRVKDYDMSGGEDAESSTADMWVAFEPTQVKSAVHNDGSFDRDDPSILSQSALEDSPAARSPLGLYSALAHHLARSPTRQATPAGWKQLIQGLINKGAVKADEVEWSGINDWLDLRRGKVTKEQVTACVEQGGVRVEETVLGAPGASFKTMSRAEMAAAYERIVGYDPVEEDPDITDANLREQLEGFAREAGEADGITEDGRPMPKYSQYTLPGGPLSRDTEILTRDGWMRMDEVQIGDEVMTRRDDDGGLEWQPVEALPTVYAEKLYHFKNQSINMRVTPCHKMVVKRRRRSTGEIVRVTAEELWGMSEMVAPLTGDWSGGEFSDLFDQAPGDVAELLGWFIAEGHYKTETNGKKSTIGIAQCRAANSEKCARIESLLNRMGIGWNYSGGQYWLSVKRMSADLVQLLHAQEKAADKYVPGFVFNAPANVIQRMLDALLLGDGCLVNQSGRKPRWTYHTKSKQLADNVQVLALLAGKRGTVSRRKTGLYTVAINDKQWASIDDAKHAVVDYNDIAYCVTVKNHSIYVRTDGVAAFTGNSNYREVLLTLPILRGNGFNVQRQRNGLAHMLAQDAFETFAQAEAARAALRDPEDWAVVPQPDNQTTRERERAPYVSPHWNYEPNVLAHIRVNDRTDADGKRVLFVEELQSDWGQEGKKNGFNPTKKTAPNLVINKIGAGFEVYNESLGRTAQDEDGNDAIFENRRDAEAMREQLLRDPYEAASGVPAAPFVTKTEGWLNLALKRLMIMAAEGGYDKVAFVNGEQCVERFRLSHRISAIKWHRTPGGIRLHLSRSAPQGLGVLEDAGLHRATELPGIVGKEIAQAIVTSVEGSGEFTGLDLRVGGDGLRRFYNEIVPMTLKRLLAKVGGQTVNEVLLDKQSSYDLEDGSVKGIVDFGVFPRGDRKYELRRRDGGSVGTYNTADEAFLEAVRLQNIERKTQPGFDVTPAMREKALQGLPLFQRQVQAKDAAPRGTFNPRTLEIALGPKADASTWIHETAHFFLEAIAELASEPNAHASIVHDMDRVLDWFGIVGTPHRERPALPQSAQPTQYPRRTALQTWMDMTLEQKRPFHEQWASAMEQYVMEGKVPSEELRPVMEVFSAWLRAIYVSTRDFLDQAAGSLTKRTIRTPTRATFGPSETLFRKALADQQAYTENPRAWFESRLHDVAQRLAALGVEAVMSGNGRPARFFSSDGEVPASGVTGQAGLLAKLYAQINAEYDAAETGRPPQFMPVGLDPDIELMPTTDRQRVVDLLTRGLRGELPTHAPLMQAPATPDPDPGPCRLTLTDDIRRVMDRLLSEQALDSWACGDEEESAATDRRERMRA